MQHPVTVGTDNNQIRQANSRFSVEFGQGNRVVTFGKANSVITVCSGKVEITDLTDKPPACSENPFCLETYCSSISLLASVERQQLTSLKESNFFVGRFELMFGKVASTGVCNLF